MYSNAIVLFFSFVFCFPRSHLHFQQQLIYSSAFVASFGFMFEKECDSFRLFCTDSKHIVIFQIPLEVQGGCFSLVDAILPF